MELPKEWKIHTWIIKLWKYFVGVEELIGQVFIHKFILFYSRYLLSIYSMTGILPPGERVTGTTYAITKLSADKKQS